MPTPTASSLAVVSVAAIHLMLVVVLGMGGVASPPVCRVLPVGLGLGLSLGLAGQDTPPWLDHALS